MSEEISQQEWEDCWEGVRKLIDQEIIDKIAEKSKNVSIEDAREALQEMEARKREHEAEEASNKKDDE